MSSKSMFRDMLRILLGLPIMVNASLTADIMFGLILATLPASILLLIFMCSQSVRWWLQQCKSLRQHILVCCVFPLMIVILEWILGFTIPHDIRFFVFMIVMAISLLRVNPCIKKIEAAHDARLAASQNDNN